MKPAHRYVAFPRAYLQSGLQGFGTLISSLPEGVLKRFKILAQTVLKQALGEVATHRNRKGRAAERRD
jgi:hypothetical protein